MKSRKKKKAKLTFVCSDGGDLSTARLHIRTRGQEASFESPAGAAAEGAKVHSQLVFRSGCDLLCNWSAAADFSRDWKIRENYFSRALVYIEN